MCNDVIILAIESSCDETAAAVVKNGRYVLSNVISSQVAYHEKFGGVVPEIASRMHIENIDYVIQESMENSGIGYDNLSAVAVTNGPGLVGALLVGLSEAKALAYSINKPLIGVNHIIGHIHANYIENKCFEPPFVCLVASGGHTHIFHVVDYANYIVLGKTHDDAAGEAYDKVARVIGLGYPGGVKLDKLAAEGCSENITFPRALINETNFNFSFSGIKSAVLNYVNKCKMAGVEYNKADIAASFQEAVTDVLVKKTIEAAKSVAVNRVALAGGVASNSRLRSKIAVQCEQNGFELNIPSPILCTDNAAMIGAAAYYKFISGEISELNLNAYSSLSIS